MKLLRSLVCAGAVTVLGWLPQAFSAEPPVYQNDFESAAVGKLPEGLMVVAGGFVVQEEKGNKFLELPGEPLDTFGLLFGPSGKGEQSVSARIFGTKQGRKFPGFGLSLGGVGGYRLVVSAAKKQLEIFKGDEAQRGVPYEWASGEWTSLRLQVRKDAKGWHVEGKAWPAGSPEPAAWAIVLEAPDEPAAGRAGLWGAPYAGTPIRFDDLLITAAH